MKAGGEKIGSSSYQFDDDIKNHVDLEDLDKWTYGFLNKEAHMPYRLINLSNDERNDLIVASTPVRQIKYLSLLLSYALNSKAYKYGIHDPLGIEETMDLVRDSESTSPLVRIISSNFRTMVSDADKPSEDISTDQMVTEEENRNRNRLHDTFPQLSDMYEIRLIAPGIAIQGDILATTDGEKVKLRDGFDQNNALGIDKDTAFLIDTIHNKYVEKIVTDKLGLDLKEVSLGAQIQLLKFMTKADNGRFDRLCSTLHGMNKKIRLKLAENFLAADFGEDFGDSLLTIASSERLSDGEKEKVFDAISSCRESINKITGLYDGFDNGAFAKEYARAANERLTDALTVFDRIATKGVVSADLEWAGKPRFSFETAMEALGYEVKSLEIISGTLNDVKTGKKGAFAEVVMHPDSSNQRLARTVYNFYSPSHGYVLLYTRPEGSHSFDPMTEYGKIRSRYDENSVNAGVEASISLIANPVEPFVLPSPFKPDSRAARNPRFYDPATMNKVSAIRLDREGRAPGMAADDPGRDPINPAGMVSVDLAAIGDRIDTPSGKIARLFSVGGKIRAEGQDTDFSLNHNTKWFDQEQYGTAEGFRELVQYMDKMAAGWCAEHIPTDEQDSFSKRMRQANRARGRKIRGAA